MEEDWLSKCVIDPSKEKYTFTPRVVRKEL